MAVTITATPVGSLRAVARTMLLSAAAGATETLTLVHNLGASPDEIDFQLRSAVAALSGNPGALAVVSWNASVATVIFGGGANGGAVSSTVDALCSTWHSIIK